MKKTATILATAMVASLASAESIMKPINDKGYGTIFGRAQSLTMYRDYEADGINLDRNGANSTLGGFIGYISPEYSGFDAGLTFNYTGEIYDNNNTALLANDPIHVLNEAWVRYRFNETGLTNTTVTAGRKINNAEVFRADDIRQKSKSIMAIQAESTDVENWRIAGGHALKWSDSALVADQWEFNDLGPNGVTWAEGTYTGVEKLELALFDAIAWDTINMVGLRGKYDINDKTAILAYLRKEFEIGSGGPHSAGAMGLSAVQKVGEFTLEGGYLGITGDGLKFDQRTIGFNHALGASLMMYAGHWNGDSDTLYFKATTQLEQSKTFLYAMYNYTKDNNTDFGGHELDLIAKQPIIENLTVCAKGGIGYKETAIGNATGTDLRLFLTYTF